MNINDLPKTGSVDISVWDYYSWERVSDTEMRLDKDAEADNPHLNAYIVFPNGEIDLNDTSNWVISIGQINQNGAEYEVDEDYIEAFYKLVQYWEKKFAPAS